MGKAAFWVLGGADRGDARSPVQEVRVPLETRAEIQQSFAPVVLNIYINKTVTHGAGPHHPAARRSVLPEVLRRPVRLQPVSVPRERVERALGSGVIIDPAGVIVTDTTHVHPRCRRDHRYLLQLPREYQAKVVSRDPKTDIGVLRIDTRGCKLAYLEFGDSDSFEVGELVLATGNSFGNSVIYSRGEWWVVSQTLLTHSRADVYAGSPVAGASEIG